MRTKPVQSSTKLLKRDAASVAAGDDRPRRIVTVDSRGKPRVKPMPIRPAAATKNGPPAQVHPRPTLASYRSMSVSGLRNCYACAELGEVRQYEARNLGKVLLCANCGENAREETFGRREPLDFAFLGGGFEGNRRRH